MTISILEAPASDIRNGATGAVVPRRRIRSALWRGFAERSAARGEGATIGLHHALGMSERIEFEDG